MSEHPMVPDHVRENYEGVRQDRGWTWKQMADQFTVDGYDELAAWASERPEDKSARGEAQGVETTAKKAPAKR